MSGTDRTGKMRAYVIRVGWKPEDGPTAKIVDAYDDETTALAELERMRLWPGWKAFTLTLEHYATARVVKELPPVAKPAPKGKRESRAKRQAAATEWLRPPAHEMPIEGDEKLTPRSKGRGQSPF